jgi:Fe2+ transport system protein B
LLREGTIAGLKKGWDGFVWMMKIIVPISLCTAILDWSGLLGHLDFLFKPLMGYSTSRRRPPCRSSSAC